MSNYNADSIKTLDFKDAIRKRVGMYLGDAGMGGVYQAAREIITNSIDEYIVGHGDIIEVELRGNEVTVKDNARGVPFGSREDGTDAMVAIYTLPHSGAKFDDETYRKVAGLHGTGAKATALSAESFTATSVRDGKKATLVIKNGIVESFSVAAGGAKAGTTVVFTPAAEVFHLEPIKIDFEVLKDMCKTWAYLSSGLTIKLTNHDTGEKVKYLFKNGLADLVKDHNKEPLHKTVIMGSAADENDNRVDVALQWSKERKELPFVFTNGLQNINGGTSLTGAKTALTRTVNLLTGAKLGGDSIRTGLCYAINASVLSPSFSDQTKTKINNPELRSLADKAITDALRNFSETNPKEWDKIVEVLVREEQAERAAEKARERVLQAEKEIKSGAIKRGFDLPDKAVDATNKTGYKELYLSEGDSAGTYLVSMRDAATQGVMKLRGKILNTFNLDFVDAFENEEVKAIFTMLGCGAGRVFDASKLRYEKIIIATDADADGSHISLLLLALFLRHAPKLIENGNVYRVISPLYGFTVNGKQKYLYSDAELEAYEKEHGVIGKLDRYKGLGAMSEELVEEHLLNSNTRRLVQFKGEDMEEMYKLFETMMGEDIINRRYLVKEGELADGY